MQSRTTIARTPQALGRELARRPALTRPEAMAALDSAFGPQSGAALAAFDLERFRLHRLRRQGA